ncbi:hypothetical protein [Psychrobacter sp. ANT_WB68]|uniref:hypothetical protein n=1 Tax=Psychrobacter sp. ANT_WB68 TaxID=2597355 RepID=UPI0011F31E1D|nr:hypothetical protein [Psychrobacter sp. ANT_WB68]KAA0915573.1 hypothetical protein FQ084_03235 [Psychrobacter sp. ANT_WB68]
MDKNTKSRVSRVPRTIKAAERFEVHKFAIRPYQIFCELFSSEIDIPIARPVIGKKHLLEVVSQNGKNLFFEDFKLMSLQDDKTTIVIRKVSISEAEVERRAWFYLMCEFKNLKPINPVVFEAIKNSMPTQVQWALFNGLLTIQRALDLKNVKRHQYNYQLKLFRDQKAHEIPSFSSLIQEAQNDIRSRTANTDT